MTTTTHPSRQEVLFIEASDLLLGLLVPLIEQLGCRVTQARDLKTAQAIIEQERPLDLVLLGEVTGRSLQARSQSAELTLLRQLREKPEYKTIPIITFTSSNDPVSNMTENGPTAQLTKPVGADDVQALLRTYLQHQPHQAELPRQHDRRRTS
jgi:CheY-like chemotaxis protein